MITQDAKTKRNVGPKKSGSTRRLHGHRAASWTHNLQGGQNAIIWTQRKTRRTLRDTLDTPENKANKSGKIKKITTETKLKKPKVWTGEKMKKGMEHTRIRDKSKT